MTQSQTNFLNKNGILTQRQQNIERFEKWMRERVKNIYAYDYSKMAAAHEHID